LRSLPKWFGLRVSLYVQGGKVIMEDAVVMGEVGADVWVRLGREAAKRARQHFDTGGTGYNVLVRGGMRLDGPPVAEIHLTPDMADEYMRLLVLATYLGAERTRADEYARRLGAT
jgi:hypothetical protein